MQRIAIIDIGSNSARLVITQMYKSGAYNMVYNQKETLRLSQKINTDGELTETAFTDTLECMNSFASMCELFHATRKETNAKNAKPKPAQVMRDVATKRRRAMLFSNSAITSTPTSSLSAATIAASTRPPTEKCEIGRAHV